MKKMIRWRVFIMNFNYLCTAFLLPKPRGSGGGQGVHIHRRRLLDALVLTV